MIGQTNALVGGGGIDENTIYINKYQKSIEGAFAGQYSLMRNVEMSLYIPVNAVLASMNGAFRQCQPKSMTIHGSTGTVTNFNSAFKENSGYLKTIDGDGLDLTSATNVGNMFQYTSGIETLIFKEGSIGITLSLSELSELNETSLASIVAGLKDLTGATGQTLYLHNTAKAKLTTAQTNAISAKNWTLA